jgi:hypothetical protein
VALVIRIQAVLTLLAVVAVVEVFFNAQSQLFQIQFMQ